MTPSCLFACLLGLVLQAPLENRSLLDRVRVVVDERYPDAEAAYRAALAQQLAGLLSSNPAISSDRVNAMIDRLPGAIRQARAYVSFYDSNCPDAPTHGASGYQPFPDSISRRRFELEMNWLSTLYKRAVESPPLRPEDRQVIEEQVDYLVGETSRIMATRLVGPHAEPSIEAHLGYIRKQLVASFESPVSANFPRLLSSAEMESLLNKVRESMEAIKDHIQVDSAMNAVQDPALQSMSPAEASARRSALLGQTQKIYEALSAGSAPLWELFELWNPGMFKIIKELESLREEVKKWKLELSNEYARKEAEALKKDEVRSRTGKSASLPSPGSERGFTAPDVQATQGGTPEPNSHSPGQGTPWVIILSSLFGLILLGLSGRRFLRTRSQG